MTGLRRYFFTLVLTLMTGAIQAHSGVVVIPLTGDDAKNLKNVITVAKANGDFTDPVIAINSIPTTGPDIPSAANRYLVVIGPGEYDSGGKPIEMQEWVSIQGSGRGSTKIFGAVSSLSEGTFAVVLGASNATLSDITIENTGGADSSYAVFNIFSSGSPRIERVNAYASGGTFRNVGVGVLEDATPVITDVIAIAEGSRTSIATGLLIDEAAPRVSNAIAKGINGGLGTNGVEILQPPSSGFLTMINVKATAEGGGGTAGGNSSGVYLNNAGSPVIENLFALGIAGSGDNYGVYIIKSSPFIKESLLSGTTEGLWFDADSKNSMVVNSFLTSVSDGAPNSQQCRDTYRDGLADVDC